MSLRVIGDQVPARHGFPNQVRALSGKFANQEKGGSCVVLFEEIEKLGGKRRIRPIVKSNREFPRSVRPVKSFAKQLRAWMYTAIRDNPRGGDSYSGDNWQELIHRSNCRTEWLYIPSVLFRFAESLQVNAKLLAFLIKVAAFEAKRTRDIRHVKIVALDFCEKDFFFEAFRALGKRSSPDVPAGSCSAIAATSGSWQG